MTKKLLRSMGSVLAGLVAILVPSNGTDAVLEATGVFPSVAVQQERGFDATWMVALAYRGVYAAAGGYVTAALAPEHPPLQREHRDSHPAASTNVGAYRFDSVGLAEDPEQRLAGEAQAVVHLPAAAVWLHQPGYLEPKEVGRDRRRREAEFAGDLRGRRGGEQALQYGSPAVANAARWGSSMSAVPIQQVDKAAILTNHPERFKNVVSAVM